MTRIGNFLDRAAIGLSAVCAIHCLSLPLLLTVLPTLVVLPIGDESFHVLLIWLVLPTSIIALSMGCRRHQQWRVLRWGFVGLAVLVFAAIFGHDLLGETLEKFATVGGALLVAAGHIMNYRHCQSVDCQHD